MGQMRDSLQQPKWHVGDLLEVRRSATRGGTRPNQRVKVVKIGRGRAHGAIIEGEEDYVPLYTVKCIATGKEYTLPYDENIVPVGAPTAPPPEPT